MAAVKAAGWAAEAGTLLDRMAGRFAGVDACKAHGIGYVLAVGCDRRIPPTPAGSADELAAGLPRHAWQRLSAGPGAKGQRYYEWAWDRHTDRAHRDDPLDPSAGRC